MKRIKKCLIFLFLIMLIIPFATAEAKKQATCSDVKAAMDELNSINEKVKTLKCDEATTEKVLSECNNLNVSRATVLEDIFEYNDDKVCPSLNTKSIVSEYKDSCNNTLSSTAKNIADTGMKIFYVIAPFLLVLFGSLDFFKIVTEGNPEQIKKHRTNFFKRVAAFVLLYITPFFVNYIFSILPYNVTETKYVCSQNISFDLKYTSSAVTGYYNVDNYGSGDAGKRIAEAAKKNLTYAKNNNFKWNDWNGMTATDCFTQKNKTNSACCADLVNSSLVVAKIYKEADMKWYKSNGTSIHSAPGTARFLINKGWKIIKNKKDLKPGDVLLYECYKGGCSKVEIDGKTYRIGHVSIYAGDNKTYDAGSDDRMKKVPGNFWTDSPNSKTPKRFLYGLRYNGK